MKKPSQIQHRRSIRLSGYDYSQAGAYFITICTVERQCLFGEVVDAELHLNRLGEIVKVEWARSEDIRQEIELNYFVIMPNHLYGIVIIRRGDRPVAPTKPNKPADHAIPIASIGPGNKTVGSFVAGFKSAATKRINIARNTPGTPVWQRNYYEHIIRSEAEMAGIRAYIDSNSLRWDNDQENPHRKP